MICLIKCIYFSLALLVATSCSGQSVTYKEGEHVPLIIILGKSGEETPRMAKIGPQTLDLEMALRERRAPILVSKTILYNFISRKQNWDDPKHPENKLFQDIPLIRKQWHLYEPQNTRYFLDNDQLYLLIPKERKHLFNKAIFNIDVLKKVSILPKNESEGYSQLIELTTPDSDEKEEQPRKATSLVHDLQNIFTSLPAAYKPDLSLPLHRREAWQGHVWDIYLSGHGSPKPDPIIASLGVGELQGMLSFFNTSIRTNTLIISSCYSGGENLKNIKFKNDINNDTLLAQLNFIVIVNSISDIPTLPPTYLVLFQKKIFFTSIFDIMQNLGNDGYHSFENLLRILGEINKHPSDIHSQANIAQIILPGNVEIQSLNPSDNVMVLGKVKARIAEFEEEPIKVYPKQLSSNSRFDHVLNLLVYPVIITVPLIMRAAQLPMSFDLKKFVEQQWRNLPTFAEIVTRNENVFAQKEETLFTREITIQDLKNNHYLYPNIISMIPGTAFHYFKGLIVEGNAFDGSGGILMALRDSFCNTTGRTTLKTFYIDSLEGPNDISLIIKAAKAVTGISQERPLEKELPPDGEYMSLHNVIISTQDEYGLELRIQFQTKEKAWEYKYSSFHWESPEVFKPQWWDFKEINASAHEKRYKTLVRELKQRNKSLLLKKKQPSLPAILRKRK